MTDRVRTIHSRGIPENVLDLATRFEVAVRYMHRDRNPEHVRCEVTIERRGNDAWALCWAGMCWDRRSAEWDYESMPSSRTDEWKGRTRFPLREAFALAPAAINQAKSDSGPLGEWIESRVA